MIAAFSVQSDDQINSSVVVADATGDHSSSDEASNNVTSATATAATTTTAAVVSEEEKQIAIVGDAVGDKHGMTKEDYQQLQKHRQTEPPLHSAPVPPSNINSNSTIVLQRTSSLPSPTTMAPSTPKKKQNHASAFPDTIDVDNDNNDEDDFYVNDTRVLEDLRHVSCIVCCVGPIFGYFAWKYAKQAVIEFENGNYMEYDMLVKKCKQYMTYQILLTSVVVLLVVIVVIVAFVAGADSTPDQDSDTSLQ